MLDVHAPHGKLEGVKDFFLHLFTISVGLLIALGLEGCVERHHKSELRHEAEANLRQEILDNRDKLARWDPLMLAEEKNLLTVLEFLAAREAGKPFDASHISLNYTVRTLSDASWRTATATGALSLMDYKEVEDYATTYQIQDQVILLQRESFEDFLKLQAYAIKLDPTTMTPAAALAVEPDVEQAYAHLAACEQIGKSLAKQYNDMLKDAKK